MESRKDLEKERRKLIEVMREKQVQQIRLALQSLPNDYPVDLRQLKEYAAYMQGARKAILKVEEMFPQLFGGKNAVRNKALFSLVTSSLKATDLFLNQVTIGNAEVMIGFENIQKNKSGKIVSADAYFFSERTVKNKL